MLFLGTSENPFTATERKLPIYYGYPQKDRYLITVNLPDGYAVESIPENATIAFGNNTGSYKYLVSQAGNKVSFSVELKMNEAILPAQEYEELKKFYQMIVDKEDEKIVLKKI